jgi:hypothetical protein
MLTFKQFLDEQLIKQGHQLGSNDGGVFIDNKTNEKHYVKYYRNPEQAKVEALTGQIYNHIGLKTLNPEYQQHEHKHAIVTKWVDGLKSFNPDKHLTDLQTAVDVGKAYHAAILTKNWDIVGLEHDNLMRDNNNVIHAIDHGGAFHFRAQGGHKDYDSGIGEKQSLRNNGHASGDVFDATFKKYPAAEHLALDSIQKIDDNHIHQLFSNSGLNDWKQLHDNFVSRKHKLIASYK